MLSSSSTANAGSGRSLNNAPSTWMLHDHLDLMDGPISMAVQMGSR